MTPDGQPDIQGYWNQRNNVTTYSLERGDEDRREHNRITGQRAAMGRPFVAPPDMPAERLKMLRDAFNATMTDADFVAEARKSKLEIEPETGEHLAALIEKIYATPKPIVDRVTSLIK